jgi:ribosome-binding protein aMBF1 (putative translation factor)
MRTFNHIAEFVKTHRRNVEIDQMRLAKKLGYKNGQFISNVERGLCSIPETKIRLLAMILNVEVSEIIDAMTADFIHNTVRLAMADKPQEEVQAYL